LASNPDDLELKFRRTGGLFAGNPLELELRGSELGPEELAAWSRISESGLLDEAAGASGAPPMGADEYQYDLVVTTAGGQKPLRFTESTVPEELGPLVRSLEQRAEDELRKRAGR
jgi:hypothetical protein